MARIIGRLTALEISKKKMPPGMHADGGGLYLQVTKDDVRSWIFRYMRDGKERYMGLGPLHAISLADARVAAAECRRKRTAGIDPIDERENRRAIEKLDAARAITFSQCAERFIESHKDGWRNTKHAAQWTATIKAYAEPVIGTLPVQAVDVASVMKILDPIWKSKTETASRVRGRIEAVLDWARARGYRTGENPARWRGHLDQLLPERSKVQRVQHHPALPYAEIGQFVTRVRSHAGIAAKALEFLILTATRTSETIRADWSEIDLDAKLWTVPAERTKAGREHRIPLSTAALSLLKARHQATGGKGYVFPGGKRGKPLSNMALLKLLQRMGRDDLTAHGFRSTFRDWAAERTSYPGEVAEMALGHVVSDKVEAAYRRGDLFEQRRRLAEEWAKFCAIAKPAGKVVSIGISLIVPEPLRSPGGTNSARISSG
jgi:integrase